VRRTVLQRQAPLARTAMKKRRRRKGDNSQLRIDWLEEHGSCACCGMTRFEFGCNLAVHHILQGANREDHRANFLALCNFCHMERAHGKRPHKLTRAMQLQLKIETDSEHYDRAVLQGILGRRILEQPEPVPPELRVRR
jgi:hypothetical protein